MSERSEPKWTASAVDSRIAKLVSSVVKPAGFKRGKWFWTRQGILGNEEVTGGVHANYGFAMEIGFEFRVSIPPMNRVLGTYLSLTEKQRESFASVWTLSLELKLPEFDSFRFGNFVELDRATPDVQEAVDRGLRFLGYADSIQGIDLLLNSADGRNVGGDTWCCRFQV